MLFPRLLDPCQPAPTAPVQAALATAAVVGIIEAQVNYVPTLIAVKKRPLPKVQDAPASDATPAIRKADAPGAWILPTVAPRIDVGENGRSFFGGEVGVVGAF